MFTQPLPLRPPAPPLPGSTPQGVPTRGAAPGAGGGSGNEVEFQTVGNTRTRGSATGTHAPGAPGVAFTAPPPP